MMAKQPLLVVLVKAGWFVQARAAVPGGGVWPLPCPLRGRKEAEGAILGPCQYKHQVCKKGREEKGMTEEGMVGWHH